MRVRFTPNAQDSLFEIADFIAQENPSRALTFRRDLEAKAREIGRNPLLYPLDPRRSDRGVRRRVYGRYVINYRVDDTVVIILDIRHGARDPELEL